MSSRYVTAIDIGTSKLAVIVGEKTSTGIRIIGYSESALPSDGVRRSEIMNPMKVISVLKATLQKVLEQVHSLPDTEHYLIRDVYVNISGQSLRCCSAGMSRNRQDPDSMISAEEVSSMLEEMYLTKVENNEQTLFVVPQYYNVDEFMDVGDPCRHGWQGNQRRLPPLRRGGRDRQEKQPDHHDEQPQSPQVILIPHCSSASLLTDDEKELGTVLVDIGAGTTDILIYQGNIIRHAAVIPFAGNSISEDISQICGVSLRNAELMKIQHGSCVSEYAPENKIISIRDKNGIPVKDVPFKLLYKAIEARTCEILATVRRIGPGIRIQGPDTQRSRTHGRRANLNHIQILARAILGMDVRIGLPDSNTVIGNSVEEVFRPDASVAVGLVVKGFDYEEILPPAPTYRQEAAPQPADNATLFEPQEGESGVRSEDTSDQNRTNSATKKTPKPQKTKIPISERIKSLFDSTDDNA